MPVSSDGLGALRLLPEAAACTPESGGAMEIMSAARAGSNLYALVSADFLKAHWSVAERAGLLALQPLIDARQVEVVPAGGPYLWVLCTRARLHSQQARAVVCH